jgi:hypothetical protein
MEASILSSRLRAKSVSPGWGGGTQQKTRIISYGCMTQNPRYVYEIGSEEKLCSSRMSCVYSDR